MRTLSAHFSIKSIADFYGAVQKIAKATHTYPLFAQQRSLIREKLSMLDVIPTLLDEIADAQEVLIETDGPRVILVRTIPTSIFGAGRERTWIDVLSIAADEDPIDVRHAMRRSRTLLLAQGPYLTPRKRKALEDRLGEVSPNGRKLADRSFRDMLDGVIHDEVREDLRSVLSAAGGDIVPLAFLNQLDRFNGRHDDLESLISRPELFDKQSVLHCSSCHTAHLAFGSDDLAAAVVGATARRCVTCGGGALTLVPGYSVAPGVAEGLRGGIWLEALTAGVVEQHTSDIWLGQMAENTEIDVLALAYDVTLLFECKDTSFGQTDLYVAAMKAEAVDADHVVAVSTRDIHPNVRSAADRMMKSEPESRRFTFISRDSADAIRREIDELLCQLRERRLRERRLERWFVDVPDSRGRAATYRTASRPTTRRF